MSLDMDVARLKVLRADHQSQLYRLEDKLLTRFHAEIEKTRSNIRGFQSDVRIMENNPIPKDGFSSMEISGQVYTEKADAGKAILAACQSCAGLAPIPLGSYQGFKMEMYFDSFARAFQLTLKGSLIYRVDLGDSPIGNITRLDNAIASIPNAWNVLKNVLPIWNHKRKRHRQS